MRWMLLLVLVLLGCRDKELVLRDISARYHDAKVVPFPGSGLEYRYLVFDSVSVRYMEYMDEHSNVPSMDVILRNYPECGDALDR